jgi:hypothetical protein
MVAMKVADEAVRPDSDITTGLRCLEQLRRRREEDAAVRQGNVDGYP